MLLHLRNGARDAWAVLLGADATRVRLSLDGQAVAIDRITLARLWNGDYTALWRGPADLALPLADNSTGDGLGARPPDLALPACRRRRDASMPTCRPPCAASRPTAAWPAMA